MKKLIHTHRIPIVISVMIVVAVIFTLALRSIAADNPVNGGKTAEIESTVEGKKDNDVNCNEPGVEDKCYIGNDCGGGEEGGCRSCSSSSSGNGATGNDCSLP